MKRALLIGLLLSTVCLVSTLIGGAVKKEPVTIVRTKPIRLLPPAPTQGYEPYKPSDVIRIRIGAP